MGRSVAVDRALWAATVVCGAVTLWLSLWFAPPGTSAFGGADKVEHAFAYFVTTLLFLLAAVWRPGRGEGVLARWEWWVLGGVVAAGGAVELLQLSVGREAEMDDWLAEIAAVVCAALVLRIMRARAEAGAGAPRGDSSTA